MHAKCKELGHLYKNGELLLEPFLKTLVKWKLF